MYFLRDVYVTCDVYKGKRYNREKERLLLVIPEAVRFVPDKDKADHPQIPWRDIATIGNILRHGYDIVDPQRIWDVVQFDLAALGTAVASIMKSHTQS